MNAVEAAWRRVLERPRRQVDCIGPCTCGSCWWCEEAPRRVLVPGTAWLTDVSRGTRSSVRIVDRPGVHDGELARPWLRECLERAGRRRFRRSPDAERLLALRPPRWWTGEHRWDRWTYVDLEGAYPSIYSRLGLDPLVLLDEEIVGLGLVEAVDADDLPKLAHRVVGGAIRSTRLRVWRRGELVEEEAAKWTPTLSPGLWAAMMLVLGGVAVEAVRCGAVMWDTDGGIVPSGRAPELIERIEQRFGLVARVRVEGWGAVWGVKHWDVGPEATRQPYRRVLAPERAIPVASPRVMTQLRLLTGGIK